MDTYTRRLHQRIPRRVLTLGQRISIAADVASALDYMHNQLTPPLIHCDLKPSNVLLDYDMTSRLGDFGSAKFLSSSLIISSPEGLVGASGTIGYIAPGKLYCAIWLLHWEDYKLISDLSLVFG